MVPSTRQKVVLIVLVTALTVTGIVWRWLDLGPATSSVLAMKGWLLKVHGAAAFVSMVLFGAVVTTHALPLIVSRETARVATGILTVLITCLLIVTGYLLYYGGIEIRSYASQIHFWSGIGATAVLAAHLLCPRRH